MRACSRVRAFRLIPSLMRTTRSLQHAAFLSLSLLLPHVSAHAQSQITDTTSMYRRPPEQVAKIVEAAPTPSVSLSPTRTWMILLDRESLPPVRELAAPMLRLAGRRINPNTNGPHGPRRFVGMSIRTVMPDANGSYQEQRIELPGGEAGIGSPSWNAAGDRFVFAVTFSDRVELWTGTIPSNGKPATAKRVIASKLNTAAGGIMWLPDGRVLARLVPQNRGPKPVEPVVPTGPVIQATSGVKAQVRTYQDLLKNAYDEDLFDWVSQSQLAIIDLATGATTNIADVAVWGQVDPSPDGKYLFTSRLVRPYSYTSPAGLFSEEYEIRDLASGKVVHELRKSSTKDREAIPIEGVELGPRNFEWVTTAPATMLWSEALDGGDPKNKADFRDKLLALDAPFTGQPRELLKTQHRFSGTDYFQPVAGTREMLVSEYDRDRKWSRTWVYDFDNTQSQPRLMTDLSVNDRYNDPGNPLRVLIGNGLSVIRVNDGKLFMAGEGATPEGDRPFLDLMSLTDFKTARLWRSDAAGFESIVDVMSDGKSFITSFESPSDYPNYYARALNLAAAASAPESAAGDRTPITTFKDPVPEVRQVKKELVKYTRNDGVELSATLYLPPNYDKARDGPLPLFIWAYPLEYTDKSTAGQVSAAPNTFVRMGGISHLCLTMAGYAVMDAATMPVVGDPETVNDTFVTQIVSSAQAAIDKAAELGVGDPHRVAVGGHSYGAFMTANLLAHCNLFKAGVARSGAYNRTLTPFGFQGERRTYWEATDTYNKMSPFTYAGNIKTPLLMIHGQIDNNPGTFPIQSERLFAAIKGLGGTARLVMLPYESHGYSAMESALHVQAETIAWLDEYVKNAKPTSNPAPTQSSDNKGN